MRANKKMSFDAHLWTIFDALHLDLKGCMSPTGPTFPMPLPLQMGVPYGHSHMVWWRTAPNISLCTWTAFEELEFS